MAITGDHYVANFEGHTIELVRNNWNKTLILLLDGKEVASASRALPHTIRLTATFDHNGLQHTLEAVSEPHLLTAHDFVMVDKKELILEKKQ